MAKANSDFLAEVHKALAEELMRRIKDGTATAADLNCARQFLKDNGIDTTPTGKDPISNLMAEMPFSTDDLYN